MELLSYSVSDLQQVANSNEGEFAKRKAFRELSGCPLLPMSDGSVQPFPKFPKDRLSYAPASLHAVLPAMSRVFIHPSAFGKDGHELLKNELALDTLFVGKFSAAVLKEHMNLLLPRTWRQCDAVQWHDSLVPSSQLNISGAGRGIGYIGHAGGTNANKASEPTGPPSELVLFCLWKEVLFEESRAGLEDLSEWPITPVISRGRRVLIPPSVLFSIFFNQPTEEQDACRSHFNREAGRLSLLKQAECEESIMRSQGARHGGVIGDEDWAWTVGLAGGKKRQSRISNESLGHSVEMLEEDKGNDEDEDKEKDKEKGESGGAQSSHSAGNEGGNAKNVNNGNEEGAGAEEVVELDIAALTGESSGDDEDGDSNVQEAGEEQMAAGLNSSSAYVPAPIMAAMQRLGIPILDAAIFDGPPRAITEHMRSPGMTLGRRLLDCLYVLSVERVAYVHTHQALTIVDGAVVTSPNGTISEAEMEARYTEEEPMPLLDFDLFDEDGRALLLQVSISIRFKI